MSFCDRQVKNVTRLQRNISILVSIIIIVALGFSVTLSITFGSAQNDETFAKITSVGLNVFRAEEEEHITALRDIYMMWKADNRAGSAIKRGYVGTLSEIYLNNVDDEKVFCVFTDENGEMLWASNNYNLKKYDVAPALKDEIVSGFYTDENIPLSVVFIAPITYRAGDATLIVGAVMLGYELTDREDLCKIKAATSCDNIIYIKQNDKFIMSADSLAQSEEVDLNRDDSALPDMIANSENGSYSGKCSICGSKYLVSAAGISDIYGRRDVFLLSGMPTTESDNARRFMIGMSVSAAIGITLIAFFLLTLSLKHMAVVPIMRSRGLAEAMDKGDLHYPDFTSRFPNNEIGDFALTLQHTKNTLSSYIEDISHVLDLMASGDFTARPSLKYEGDFVRINESFESIRHRMSDIVNGINRSSQEVYSGSEQMSQGSAVLADGTVTQAAAIDDLNDRIDTIVSRTKANADNAVRCRELSDNAAKSSEEQNITMQRLSAAMRDIEDKSRQINNIIQTIDSIAFQTNILALNAAVEAARAGSSGKGFAVVADEVRNLASKSADAVKETARLIDATTEAVAEGVRLAEEAAASMNEIAEQTADTGRLVNKIAEKSLEQSEDINEINKALERISGVVAQNSATAEETAASCEELTSQSRELTRQIQILKA